MSSRESRAMASETIEVAALGRPLYPGMLYDCRKDSFIPGVTLWDKKSLSEDLDTRPQPKTYFDLSSSDSLSSKSSLLNVSASLKASFLGGLVEVEGSAKFLRDTKSSNQQSRVAMYYSETSRFDQLTMTHLGDITYPQVFDQKTATHVVTAVLYGAQAFMVFDRTFSEEEEKQDIEGELNVMVKKIPQFSIEGKGTVEMTDGDKQKAESIACRFHGDFRLEQNPTTYTEAVEVYKKLPNHLKENPQNAVPIRVWLYPLSLLDTKAARLEREITTRLVSKTEDIIEKLGEVERTCNDLSRKPLVNVFRDIKERLRLFQGSISIYQTVLMKAVARVLPAIRGGEMEEKSLEDILKIHYSSPFTADRLNQWLDGAKSELNLLSSHIKMLDGIKTEDSDHLNSILLNLNIDFVVCLTFTSLKYEDPYLSTLKEFLESEEFKELDVFKKLCSSMTDPSEEWFNDPDVISKMRETLSIFKSFSEANKDEKRYRFIMSAISDPSSPGSSLRLYEKGKLTDTQFQPVSKPPPPEVKEVLERSVSLKLQKSPTGETVRYRVEYQQLNEEQWHVINTPDEDFTLTGLEFGKQYLIRYRIVGKVGVSEASDTIGPITPEAQVEPDQEKTIRLCQSAVNNDQETSRENTSSKTMGKHHSDGKGSGVAHIIKNSWSRKIEDGSNENLPMFKLKLDETWQNSDGFCRRITFGRNIPKENKTIMMIGATGAGKTTLINSMINYILGVQWADDFRFVLIDEGKQKSQAESQTSEITAYQINHMDGFQVPYSLTIVDTPGFGDTRGISHDQKITKQIQEFFSARGGIDRIDAVCFVVQASLARLTHTQKYVFDSILSIFGKDIAENILMMVTFADGKTPPVLEAIRVSEVPCSTNESGQPLHFKFNNSAVFATNNKSGEDEESDCENFDQMFWKLGFSSMRKFFTSLRTMETKSLSLTREVLKERQQLEVLVEGLQTQINAGLRKLEEIKKTRADLEQHKVEMDENKNFEYELEVTVPKQIENKTGYFLSNCQQCHFTCNDKCTIANDSEKYKSSVFKDGKCTVCPGKCVWNVHFNQKYKWTYVSEKRKGTYQDLKKRFEAAHGQAMTKEKIFEELEKELEIVQDNVTGLIERSQKSLERLQEIALKPNPLTTPDYIDLMIESEKQEAKPGFQDRILSLMGVRQKAEIICKVSMEEVLPEHWKQYKLATRKKESSFDLRVLFSKAVNHAFK